MSSNTISKTSFECKLCGELIVFHINESSSFIAKTDEKKFAGMVLGTYRVGHSREDIVHINVVTVDHRGHWRAFIDAYEEEVKFKAATFELLDTVTKVLESSDTFEIFILLNYQKGWIFEIVCPTRFIPVEIAKSIVENFEAIDDEIIQPGILINLNIVVGAEAFEISMLGDYIAVYLINREEKHDVVTKLLERLFSLDLHANQNLLHRDTFNTLVEIIDNLSPSDLIETNLIRLIEEGTKINPLRISDFGIIPDIVSKLMNQKSYSEHLIIAMISLLSGQSNLVELLHQGYLQDYNEIIEIVDFIRVKLLTDSTIEFHMDEPPEITQVIESIEQKPNVTEEEVDTDALFDDLPPLVLEEKRPKTHHIVSQKQFEPADLDIQNEKSFEHNLDFTKSIDTSSTYDEKLDTKNDKDNFPEVENIEQKKDHKILFQPSSEVDNQLIQSDVTQKRKVNDTTRSKLKEIAEKRKKLREERDDS
ncbi:MAG: hypothetical protein ACW98K_02090 [Candidatus Kariarchaeaceae archaeon]|jgi:hypothetical protein